MISQQAGALAYGDNRQLTRRLSHTPAARSRINVANTVREPEAAIYHVACELLGVEPAD